MATERTPLVPKMPAEATRYDFALLMTGIWSLTFISSLDATIVATLITQEAYDMVIMAVTVNLPYFLPHLLPPLLPYLLTSTCHTIGSSLEYMQLSSWIGTSYLLSLCAFTPLYGRLANIFGRRPSILFAGTVFGVGTILCGFAQNMPQLIACRALAGIRGGGMTVVGSVIVSDSVPLKSRGLYQGFTNLLFGLSDAIVREPALVLAAAGTSITAKLKRIDYASSASLVLTLLTFLVEMNFKTTASLILQESPYPHYISTVSACSFLLIELKFAAEPILPMSMLKRVKYLVGFWYPLTAKFAEDSGLCSTLLSFSTVYNTPLYFTAARLRTSADAGAHLIPNSVCVAIGSLFAGWYMRKTSRYWKLQALAGLCIVAANFILASWNSDTPEWVLYTTLMPSGFGFVTTLTTTLLALIASVPRDDIPLVTGRLSYLFRTSGQVLDVSLSAALTQTLLVRNLRVRIADSNIIAKILASTAYIHTLPADLQHRAAKSWALALRVVFYCQIVLAVSLFLSSLPIEHALPDTFGAAPVKPATHDTEAVRGE
ncbi:major facilitator superfamily domain-containing protein [Mycena epipterygia]|nr:major facilitator superfamily domain-containing protein [Mycena epipterygia]